MVPFEFEHPSGGNPNQSAKIECHVCTSLYASVVCMVFELSLRKNALCWNEIVVLGCSAIPFIEVSNKLKGLRREMFDSLSRL